MATDIIMPNLGFDAQEGELIEWLKDPGDVVKKGEVIALIESDKATVELESVASGTLLETLASEGERVPVGAVIARIGAADEQISAPPTQAASGAAVAAVDATPVARRMAAEHNLDLSGMRGSGPRGRITREDVQAALDGGAVPAPGTANGHRALALPKVRKAAREAGVDLTTIVPSGHAGQVTMDDLQAVIHATEGAPAPPPAFDTMPTPPPLSPPDNAAEVPLSRMRQTIGARLQQSKNEAPHFYVTGEFDLEDALRVLPTLPGAPRINDLLQYLVVQTLLRVPQLNATYRNGSLYHHAQVDLAIAVAREDGLITPVVPAAEGYSLQGLASAARAVITRARENRLQPDDLREGTFTISNLGIIPQVRHFTAVINPPQVAILAVGAAQQRPVVIDGGLHIRHMVEMTLSGDHRAVDGMDLGRFMATFQAELDRVTMGR
ncbi:MAG: dihydrolipoamide acetyltransferase family protein [Anaerolineales bacterium]